jgi:hypothetical protein
MTGPLQDQTVGASGATLVACSDDAVAAIMDAWSQSWREFPLTETRTPRRCSSWPVMVLPPISWAA